MSVKKTVVRKNRHKYYEQIDLGCFKVIGVLSNFCRALVFVEMVFYSEL